MGLPSWKRASGRNVKVTEERSSGTSIDSATRAVEGERLVPRPAHEGLEREMPAVGPHPLMMKGLRLSKVPVRARRNSPPFGASGLA